MNRKSSPVTQKGSSACDAAPADRTVCRDASVRFRGTHSPFPFFHMQRNISECAFRRPMPDSEWQIGYQGIEIMPGTLSENPAADFAQPARRVARHHPGSWPRVRRFAQSADGPSGLEATYQRSSRAAARLGPCAKPHRSVRRPCADRGPKGVLVFGSGKQRQAPPGVSNADALARFREGLASVAPHALERGVTILMSLSLRICAIW